MRTKPLLWAEIDLGRLKNNLRLIRANLRPRRSEVLAVVKADAYGHGMKAVARLLAGQGVRFFGVATIEEALELRQVCRRQRILVLGSFHSSQVPLFIRHKITPTISSVSDAALFESALDNTRAPFSVHIKIDTGMGRLGVWHQDAEEFFRSLKKFSRLHIEGVYTHFSSADGRNKRATRAQIKIFNGCVRRLTQMGFAPRYLHAANSMGLVRFKEAHFNLARPGIILYGIDPSGRDKTLRALKPVMSLKTRVAFLKPVSKGRTISYGATYRTTGGTRIATLPVGYSHGYRVAFSNRAQVLIRGRRFPVVGRVTMDQTLVDVGSRTPVRRWDEVTLLGRDGKQVVSASELAAMIGTIPYEIVCSVHSRIPRVYKGLHS